MAVILGDEHVPHSIIKGLRIIQILDRHGEEEFQNAVFFVPE